MCKIRMRDGIVLICMMTPTKFCELWKLAIENKTLIKLNTTDTSDKSEKYLNPMHVICVSSM
jgi:hypothetical protein